MMFPSVFGENLFDDWMDDFGFRDNFFSGKNPLYGKHAKNIMKTDVRETDKGYELDVDLPGFKKDEVHAALENGYLTISAEKGLDKDEKEKESGRYIRRERYAGACSRSFYVGEDIQQEDVKAEFKNGILLWCGFKIIFTDKFGSSVDGFVYGSPALIIGIRCRTHTWVAVVCFYSIKVVNFDTLFNVFCNKFATASCV